MKVTDQCWKELCEKILYIGERYNMNEIGGYWRSEYISVSGSGFSQEWRNQEKLWVLEKLEWAVSQWFWCIERMKEEILLKRIYRMSVEGNGERRRRRWMDGARQFECKRVNHSESYRERKRLEWVETYCNWDFYDPEQSTLYEAAKTCRKFYFLRSSDR